MAGNKVYITLEVDDKGTAVMKKFGGNTDKAFDKLKKNAKAGAAQAGKMENAWEKSMSHMKAHWKGYALAGGAALAATAYAVKQFADASSEAYKEYNTAVTDMGKITDETAESIKSKIGSIPPKYGDATELTKAYYNVISAGVIEPVAAMDTLTESVKAAKAAHIESAETVTGITALMEAYGDKIKGASESADLLFRIEASGKTTVKELIPYIGELAGKSAALGITQDELGASFAQVTLLSGSTSNAATQYKAILTSLMAPSEAMTKLLGKYGGAQKAIADMGFEGVLKLIAEESGGNAAALQKLMGSAEAVGGTLTLLGNDMAGYSQRLADMKDKTGLAAKAFNDWEKSMEGIEATYDASVKNIMIAFGKEIAPLVAGNMQMIIDMGPTIINAIHTAFDFIQVTAASLIDQLMRGWVDLEYAFKTMVAGIKGAWKQGIDVIEEAFADFLYSVAAGLDKIPFFSDNATASMRDLADKVRANTDASEGFVASIMKVQTEKEKELIAHNKIIDALIAEALGYKETALQAANASVEKQKAARAAADAAINANAAITASDYTAMEKAAEDRRELDEERRRMADETTAYQSGLEGGMLESMAGAWEAYIANTESVKKQVADLSVTMAENFAAGVGDAFAQAIVYGKSLSEAFANLTKQLAAQVISCLVKIGVEKLIQWAVSKVLGAAEATSRMAILSAETFAAAFASTCAIPIVGPALAPGVAAKSLATMLAGATGAASAGAGIGAGIGSMDQGGITDSAGLYRTGPIREAHIPIPSGGKIPVEVGSGSQQPSLVLNIYGDVVDYDEFARKIVPALNKAVADGVH